MFGILCFKFLFGKVNRPIYCGTYILDVENSYYIFLGGAVFWVIGASIFVVALHATFYNYDALEINDQQPLTGNIVEEV